MSGPFQTGQHPDADSLAGFMEGVLPEHERLACLAHFADCPRCRDVVFAAQEPEAIQPVVGRPVASWRRWFAPVPILAGVAAACMLGGALWFYAHRGADRPAKDVVAREAPVVAPEPPSASTQPRVVVPPVTKPIEVPHTAAVPVGRTTDPLASPENRVAEMPPSLPQDTSSFVVSGSVSNGLPASGESSKPAVATTAELSGTVTDPTGAAVPDALIAVRPVAGGSTTDLRSDPSGKFQTASLAPGRYEVRIQARGFLSEVKQVDLKSDNPTHVASVLNVGATSETVEVTAAAATVDTQASTSSTISTQQIRELPLSGRTTFNLATATKSASIGKIMLAVRADGQLYVTRDSGQTWSVVKAAWKEAITELVTIPKSAGDPEHFQITTTSGDRWLSHDGTHWRPPSIAPKKK
jgi:hypothetical protein